MIWIGMGTECRARACAVVIKLNYSVILHWFALPVPLLSNHVVKSLYG